MEVLHRKDLVEVLLERARTDAPLLGICLGMELLADSSEEFGQTPGLGLIPGQIRPLKDLRWHIGWNSIESTGVDALFQKSDGEFFYFNHSFAYEGPAEFVAAVSRAGGPMVAAVRRQRVVGVQFHPEKSQQAGRRLLSGLIDGLCGQET
jgi:glutamine amidotransferase